MSPRPSVAEAVALLRRVDRLVLAADRHPHRAVQLVAVVDRDPGAAEGIGVGRDVVGVLVPALPRLARRLEEEHRLQGQHVRPDQRLEDVEHPRVEQVALVQLQLAVEHVDAQEVLRLLLGREVVRRRFQPLASSPAVGVGPAPSSPRCSGSRPCIKSSVCPRSSSTSSARRPRTTRKPCRRKVWYSATETDLVVLVTTPHSST